MPQAGGESSKFGDRYEGRCTVLAMCAIMEGRAASIEIEIPGEDKVEFLLQHNDQRSSSYQVKRQKTGSGNWTTTNLLSQGVIQGFLRRLEDPSEECIFQSGHTAAKLEELCDRARKANELSQFKDHLGTYRAEFDSILKSLVGLDPLKPTIPSLSEEEVFQRLKRVRVDVISESVLKSFVLSQLTYLVDAPPANVLDALAALAIDARGLLTQQEIWFHLKERNMEPRVWDKDSRVIPAIADACDLFCGRLEPLLINKQVIQKKDMVNLCDTVESEDKVLLLGSAGMGKSTNLYSIAKHFEGQGFLVLPIRLTSVWNVHSTIELGQTILRLPVSPAVLLSKCALEGRALLLIDQLDTLSLMQSASGQDLLDTIQDLIGELARLGDVKVVLACRDVDAATDPRIQRLLKQFHVTNPTAVEPLSRQEVETELSKHKFEASALLPEQIELLRVPLHLSLFLSILEHSQDTGFRNFIELCDKYWIAKRANVETAIDGQSDWPKVFEIYAQNSLITGSRDVPEELFDHVYSTMRVMASEHVLVLQNGFVSIFHDTIFDYSLARNYMQRGETLIEYLTGSHQLLQQRTELKAILSYRRQKHYHAYIKDLRSILVDARIRSHIKQVVFDFLRSLTEVRTAEAATLACVLPLAATFTKQSLLTLFRSFSAWSTALDKSGHLDGLLSNSEFTVEALRFLPSLASEAPERAIELFQIHMDQIKKDADCVIDFLECGLTQQSDKAFDLFVHLLNNGFFENSDVLWNLVFGWSGISSDIAIKAIETIISFAKPIADELGVSNLFELSLFKHDRSTLEILNRLAKTEPATFIAALVPIVVDLSESVPMGQLDFRKDRIWIDITETDDDTFQSSLLRNLSAAIIDQVRFEQSPIEPFIELLRKSNTRTSKFLLMSAYRANGTKYGAEAIKFLLTSKEPWTINYGFGYERCFELACKIIRVSVDSADPLDIAALKSQVEDTAFSKEVVSGKQDMLDAINGIAVPDDSKAASAYRKILDYGEYPEPDGDWISYIDSETEKGIHPELIVLAIQNVRPSKQQLEKLIDSFNDDISRVAIDLLAELDITTEEFKFAITKAIAIDCGSAVKKLVQKNRDKIDDSIIDVLAKAASTCAEPPARDGLNFNNFFYLIHESSRHWILQSLAFIGWREKRFFNKLVAVFEQAQSGLLTSKPACFSLLLSLHRWQAPHVESLFKKMFAQLSTEEKSLICRCDEFLFLMRSLASNKSLVEDIAIELFDTVPSCENIAGRTALLAGPEFIAANPKFLTKEDCRMGIAAEGRQKVVTRGVDVNFQTLAQQLLDDAAEPVRRMMGTALLYPDYNTNIPLWFLEAIAGSKHRDLHFRTLLDDAEDSTYIVPPHLLIEMAKAEKLTWFQRSSLSKLILRAYNEYDLLPDRSLLVDALDLLVEQGAVLPD